MVVFMLNLTRPHAIFDHERSPCGIPVVFYIVLLRGVQLASSLSQNHLKPGVYLAASPEVKSWNDPACGTCYRASDPQTGKSIIFVALDVATPAIVTGEDGFSVLASTAVGALAVDVSALDESECYTGN